VRSKTLSANFYDFRNDGVVDNIAEHADKIFREMYSEFKYEDTHPSALAKCLSWRDEENKLAVIYSKPNHSKNLLFAYGHESVHVIQNLGLEDQFLDMLKQEGFSLNPFTYYSDRELQAHVGGIMAFYRTNKTIPRIDTSQLSKTSLEIIQVIKDVVYSYNK
jgi:hypothetical protein